MQWHIGNITALFLNVLNLMVAIKDKNVSLTE